MAKITPNQELSAQTATTQLQFVLTELDMAITFCGLALATGDPSTRARNIQNALTGYRTALRFSQVREHNMRSDAGFQEKLGSLKSLLHRLGQESEDL